MTEVETVVATKYWE